MIDMTTLPKIRDCGKLESFSTARHHLGFYNNVAFTGTYSLSQSCKTPLQNLVFPALRKVIRQHPILSAVPLAEDTKTPYFTRLPEIDLRTCVELVACEERAPEDGETDKELDRILEDQHNTNFKADLGTRPFWRIVVLYRDVVGKPFGTFFTLSWVYHHALADGSSGLVFHQAFLKALRSVPLHSEQTPELFVVADPIVKSPDQPLLPPLEQLHPLPLSLGFLLKQLWKDWFPSLPPGLWTGNPIPPSIPRMRLQSLVLSRSETSSLVSASRRNGVSMHVTLQCLIARATFANLDAKAWQTLRASGPISLRRFLKVDDNDGKGIEDHLGTFVGQYDFDHRRPSPIQEKETDFIDWAEAVALKQAIAAELDKKLQDSTTNLVRWVSDVPQFFRKKVGQQRQESFELSNVGVVKAVIEKDNVADKEQWSIGRCVFSQSASFTGSAFFVSAVTGGDGCAVLAFSWLNGAHEEGWMEQVMETLKDSIDKLVREE